MTPLLTLTLIAKNEAHNVNRLLDTLWRHVDEIVIVDTGSTDSTLDTAREYAKQHGEPGKLKTRVFTDCNDETGEIYDFSAARQAADELATGEWLIWADLDDSVHGAENLRRMCSEATSDVIAFFCHYDYARDPDGNSISELWRERVVRNDGTRWTGRLHEHKLFTHGHVVKVDPNTARWIHQRNHEERSGERNLRVLERWDAEQPDDPRIVRSIAMEHMGAERHGDAADAFARYLALPGEPVDARCQAARQMCVMLMLAGRLHDAKQAAFQALAENWVWADTHLTLAEIEQTLGRPDIGLRHARTALDIGKPDTLLIVNPLQYTAHPRALAAVCLAQMGRFEEALAEADACLRIAPSYQLAAQQLPLWRAQLRKQQALATWIASADVLVETGELVKARDALRNAPFFIDEEPQLIAKRRDVARLIRARTGIPAAGAKDDAADAFVRRHREDVAA